MLHRTIRTRILVIEDMRSATPAPWDVGLDSEYEVETAGRGDHLRSHIREFVPHLMIINSEHREVPNADLCRELRRYAESARTPILLLTDRAEECVESLDAGADDCLAKPISLQEFLLRIRGLLRRTPSTSTLRAGDILLDLDRLRVTRAGRTIHLGLTQFKLLELLMRTPGHPVPRSELMSGAWPNTRVDERTVDVNIMRLRKALTQGRRADPIRTAREVGYYLDGGKSPASSGSHSIICDHSTLNGAEQTSANRPASSSRHQLHTRGKRHAVA